MRRCLLLAIAACSGGTPMPDSGMPCTDSKSPANLVVNGGFECGDASEWSVQFGDLATVSAGAHGGSKALQLTASSTGSGQFGYATAVVQTTSGNPYCVNAWVRGTATDMRMEVLDTVGGMAQAFSSPVEAGWLQAPPSTNLKVSPAAGATLYLRLRLLNGMSGQTLVVDDVDFWESASGSCNERH